MTFLIDIWLAASEDREEQEWYGPRSKYGWQVLQQNYVYAEARKYESPEDRKNTFAHIKMTSYERVNKSFSSFSSKIRLRMRPIL